MTSSDLPSELVDRCDTETGWCVGCLVLSEDHFLPTSLTEASINNIFLKQSFTCLSPKKPHRLQAVQNSDGRLSSHQQKNFSRTPLDPNSIESIFFWSSEWSGPSFYPFHKQSCALTSSGQWLFPAHIQGTRVPIRDPQTGTFCFSPDTMEPGGKIFLTQLNVGFCVLFLSFKCLTLLWFWCGFNLHAVFPSGKSVRSKRYSLFLIQKGLEMFDWLCC